MLEFAVAIGLTVKPQSRFTITPEGEQMIRSVPVSQKNKTKQNKKTPKLQSVL